MSPFTVNPRWYEEYWMTEQPPRWARLAAALRRLVCVGCGGRRPLPPTDCLTVIVATNH